jgi:hypothetical protein
MSKHTFIKELRKELNRVNEEIDMRIIKGYSYRTLAKRHKYLVDKLNSVTRYSSSSYGFLGRLNRVVATFMF